MELNELFISVTAVAALIIPVTGYLKTHVEFLGGIKTQTFSWIVAMLVAFAAKMLSAIGAKVPKTK